MELLAVGLRKPKVGARLNPPWHRLTVITLALAGSALLAWTSLGELSFQPVGPRQQDYYNLLVSGFRKGSLALDIEVPEALKKLDNPWDADKRPPGVGGPHDVSYFNGHFYLYFGVVPAVTLFWPFRAIFGHELPAIYSFLFYSIGSFLIASWLWLRLIRDHFPRASLVTRIAGMAAVGLAGGQVALVRRTGFWELPITAGHFHMICMVAACYMALASRRAWAWLALAGLSLGLAVGSRPTLAAGGAGLAVLVIALAARRLGPGGGWKAPAQAGLRAALAAGIPLAAVVAGLLAYNYARFRNPFEFGINYQLTGAHESMGHHFRLSFIPYNFAAYFRLPPQWGRYFPFIHPIATAPVAPAGYYGIEYVYGALAVCPVIWWALGLLAGVREASAVTVRTAFAGVVMAVALSTTCILLTFNTAAARYAADFIPWWVWLGAIGWAFIEEAVSPLRALRGFGCFLMRGAFAATAVFSCTVAFLVSIELHDILQTLNPAAYEGLARVFNAPVAMAEQLLGVREGPIEMDVSFPKVPRSSFEPLVVTGVSYQRDFVFVYYQSPTVVRLGYISSGQSTYLSPNINVEPGHPYRLRISTGALYPPVSALLDKGWKPRDVDLAKKWTLIEFDGRPVLTSRASWNEATPGSIHIGSDPGSGTFGKHFSGTLAGIHRAKWSPPVFGSAQDGEFRADLVMPETLIGGNQPVAIAGRRGAADLIGLRMLDLQRHVLVYESWGQGSFESGPIPSPEDHRLKLRVRLGPLMKIADDSPLAVLRRTLIVWEDDKRVLWYRTLVPIGPDPQFQMLGNDVDSSMFVPVFKGTLESFAAGEPRAPWRDEPFEALEIDLGGRGSGTEPLVGSGSNGRSDTLAIEWSQGGRARLLYEHSGTPVKASQPFDWPEATVRTVRVEMPSFRVPGSRQPPGSLNGILGVKVDGAAVWQERVPFFASPQSSIAVGRNPAKAGFALPELTTAVLDVRQVDK